MTIQLKRTSRWLEACVAGFSAVATSMAGVACAAPFPEHPVRIVVPSAAGGSIDTTARILAAKLSEVWGRNAYVDNRPGAAMAIGATAVARAAPDGYTLLVAHNGAMSINPLVMPDIKYIPQKDFVAVSLLTDIPMVIMVNKDLPIENLQQLVASARQKPGSLNHAAGGWGSRLPSELFKSMAGIDYTEVPFSGAAPATAATMAGTTQLMITDLVSARPAVDSGRLRAIAVASERRSPFLGQVPTAQEAGVPGYRTSVWIGLFAPSATPADVVSKIQADVKKVLGMPDVVAQFQQLGMQPASGDAGDLRAIMQADSEKWRQLVGARHLNLN